MWFRSKRKAPGKETDMDFIDIASEKEYRNQTVKGDKSIIKLLLVSDSHGRNEGISEAAAREEPFDAFFHLGDSQAEQGTIEAMVRPNCPCYIVSGNCDSHSGEYPRERIVELAGHRIFLTHGHHYMVSFSFDYLVEKAKGKGCDMVMFGHTHVPANEYTDGVWVLNPGSISYPRQQGRERSYMVVYLKPYGMVDAWIRYIG